MVEEMKHSQIVVRLLFLFTFCFFVFKATFSGTVNYVNGDSFST